MKNVFLFIWLSLMTANAFGQAGNCLDFDGTDDYVALTSSNSILSGTTFSIEAWIKTSTKHGTVVDQGRIVSLNRSSGGDYDGAVVIYVENDILGFAFYDNTPGSGGYRNIQTTNSSYYNGTWHHIAVTHDGTTYTVYFNGVSVNTNTQAISNSPFGSDSAFIGSRGWRDRFFQGQIDEVRIWNVALTQTEIRERMHREISGSETNLVAYYQFNQSYGTTASDAVGINHGTLYNGPTWVTSTAPLPYQSLQTGTWNTATTWLAGQGFPTNTWAHVLINNGHTVTTNGARSAGYTYISSGAELNVSGGAYTITNGPFSADCEVNGILRLSTHNNFSISAGATLVVNDGGKYIHNTSGASSNVPNATWNTGSTCEIRGPETTTIGNGQFPINLNQNFHHFIIAVRMQNASEQNVQGPTSITGNFIVQDVNRGSTGANSKLSWPNASTTSITIGGDFRILSPSTASGFYLGNNASGVTINVGGDFEVNTNIGDISNQLGITTFNFNKSGTQSFTYTQASTFDNFNFTVANGSKTVMNSNFAFQDGRSWTVNSGGTLTMGTNVISGSVGGTTFTLASGGTLEMGSADGISSSGATGNIQTATRVFSQSANYTYNGIVAQITGNGLPPNVANLKIDNAAGVTLTNNVEVNGVFTNTANSVFNTSDKTCLLKTTGATLFDPSEHFNNGTININPAGLFETYEYNEFTNTTTGTINVLSDATGDGSFINDDYLYNDGAFKVHRYLTGSSSLPYHYISVPVEDAPYWYIRKAGDYVPYWYDETTDNADLDYGWTAVRSGNLTLGRGYARVSKENETLVFTGTPVDYYDFPFKATITYTNTTQPGTGWPKLVDPRGWNLVGNPYPAAIDASMFLLANHAELDPDFGAVYFWDDKNGVYNRFYDYAVFNRLGGSPGPHDSITRPVSGGATPSGVIAMGQGFFIKAKSSMTGDVAFNQNQRVRNTSNQFFIPDPDPIGRFSLGITNPDKLYNEILIGFTNEATFGLDHLWDARKLKGNPKIALYSLLKGEDYAIQALPRADHEVTVLLGLDIGTAGTHTFKVANMENLHFGDGIMLVDNYLNTATNLMISPEYKFHSDKGVFKDRFYLTFLPSRHIDSNWDEDNLKEDHTNITDSNIVETGLTTTIITSIANDLKVYRQGSDIIIYSPESFTATISLYDVSGKLISEHNKELGKGISKLGTDNLSEGIYMLRISSDHGTISRKLMF